MPRRDISPMGIGWCSLTIVGTVRVSSVTPFGTLMCGLQFGGLEQLWKGLCGLQPSRCANAIRRCARRTSSKMRLAESMLTQSSVPFS
jgi:hypothetical protein